MHWSHEQLSIFEAFDTESRNILVEAAPGSGKTTVLCELWRRSTSDNILDLAFNKSIVQELQQRLPQKGAFSRIATYNSFGHSVCMKAWPNVKLDTQKVYRHINATVGHLLTRHGKRDDEKRQALHSLVMYMKNDVKYADIAMDPGAYAKDSLFDAIGELIDYYDIDRYDGIIEHALRVLRSSCEDIRSIDFSDQLLFPLLYDLHLPEYEQVMVDEYQDTNAVQRALLLKLSRSNPDIRYVLVGDGHQSIYAFRGVYADVMRDAERTFECTTYPLTLTRRCAKAIVGVAQTIYPDAISSLDDSPNGVVRECLGRDAILAQQRIRPVDRDYSSALGECFTADAMLLCRTVAPMVRFAYELLRKGIPCHIRGRDIGAGLVKYIRKLNCVYKEGMLFDAHQDIRWQIELAERKEQHSRVQSLTDKLDTLEVFCEASKGDTTESVIDYITEVFSEGKGMMLSSIHKAKGLEAERVYILAPDLMPHPMAKQSWEREQERNVEYVAVTRAKSELVYI